MIVGLSPAGCAMRADRPDGALEEAAERLPQQESWGVVFHISEDGNPRVDIAAGHAAEYAPADSSYVLLTDEQGDERVLVHLFDARGDSSAVLTAHRIRYYEDFNRFVALGDVQVRTADEKRLWTEKLIWLEESRSIRAPGFARLSTPKENITGYDLTADEDLSTYRLGEVTGSYLRTVE